MMKFLKAILVVAAAVIIPACDGSAGSGGGSGGGGVESAGALQFESTTYTFNESIPPMFTIMPLPINLITVTRQGGGKGEVSVMVLVTGGTATQGLDYSLPIPGPLAGVPLAWADGETGPKSFQITIIDDKLVEGNETVELALADVTGGATLGDPSKATVTILDNDSPIVGPSSP